jgi:hypothetical protein
MHAAFFSTRSGCAIDSETMKAIGATITGVKKKLSTACKAKGVHSLKHPCPRFNVEKHFAKTLCSWQLDRKLRVALNRQASSTPGIQQRPLLFNLKSVEFACFPRFLQYQ